jgi:two-component system, sensor histidine kinase and response regulator
MSLEIQCKAVVVDDDLVYLQTVGLMLKKLGFQDIKLFSNPIDALTYIQTTKIDLIVSDWDMPLMTGCEFLERIRKNPKTNSIPFILNTGNHSEAYWRQAIIAGVTEFLFKPFSFNDFRDSVLIAIDLASYDRRQNNSLSKLAC